MGSQNPAGIGRTWPTAVAILASGLIPLAALFAIGFARAIGVGGFPQQHATQHAPFWKITWELFLVGLFTPLLAILGAWAYLVSRPHVARAPANTLLHVSLIGYVLLLSSYPVLLAVFQHLGVVRD